MRTFYFEAAQSREQGPNWGKFLVGVFTDEWSWITEIGGHRPALASLGTNPDSIWVADLQTGEAARFNPGGSAAADLDKHRIWVCPMYEPFLAWLYTRLDGLRGFEYPTALVTLPTLVELPDAPFAFAGYRRPGPPEGAPCM